MTEDKQFWAGKLADYGGWGVMLGVLLWGGKVYLVPLIEQQQQALAVQMSQAPEQTKSLRAIQQSNEGILLQAERNGEAIKIGLQVAPSDVLQAVESMLKVQPSQVLDHVKILEAKLDRLLDQLEKEK